MATGHHSQTIGGGCQRAINTVPLACPADQTALNRPPTTKDVASRLVAREYASTSWLSNQGLQWDGIATRSVSGDVALPIFFVVRTEILHQFLVGEQSQLLGNGQRRLEGARVTVGDVDRQVPTAGTMQFDS